MVALELGRRAILIELIGQTFNRSGQIETSPKGGS
jgi:hypothetical protein